MKLQKFLLLLLPLGLIATAGEAGWDYRYWFDSDDGHAVSGQATDATTNLSIDVNALPAGLHTLHMQVSTDSAGMSAPVGRMFVKLPVADGTMNVITYIDGKQYSVQSVQSSGGVMTINVDVSQYGIGMHTISARTITADGVCSSMADGAFMRVPMQREVESMAGYYIVDNNQAMRSECRVIGGVFHLDLDMAELTDGLHSVTCMLSGDKGLTTSAVTSYFYKTPLGGEGIDRYDYWINDDMENMKSVTLAERTNPFNLIELLNVDTYPLSSKSFHFQVDDGQPAIYAKNTFYLRTMDGGKRFTIGSTTYVDTRVKQPIDPASIKVQKDDITHYEVEPTADNEIKWFAVDAKTGDSIAVNIDRACTIDLFSADGTKLLSSIGADALQPKGAYILNDGRYYIAVHDMANQNQPSQLTITRFDKFAVLSYSPSALAPIGDVYVNLFGNGYERLKDVHMTNGSVTVKAKQIHAFDRNNAKAWFAFGSDSYQYSDYSLILTFEDEDGTRPTVERPVKFESPEPSDIKVEVVTERRLANPYPVRIVVHNTGNVSYQAIPLQIAYDNVKNINNIVFNNFAIPVTSKMQSDGVPLVIDTNNLFDRGIEGRYIPMMLPNLNPYEERVLELGIVASGHTSFNLYAWAGTPWSEDAKIIRQQKNVLRAQENNTPPQHCSSNYINLREIADAAGDIVNLGQGIGDVMGGIIMATGSISYNAWMTEAPMGYEEGLMDMNPYKANLPTPMEILGHFPGVVGNIADAVNSFLRPCPQNREPEPDPVPVETLAPGDPNDIIGYTAPSGSNYVGIDVERVSYVIEFENDPEIANASAHNIVIEDKLDPDVFDLSTFAPQMVKIGGREMTLSGEKTFIRTMDLRPEINALAQITLDFNENTGIARWIITALDPMTMEPTDDDMQGVLPVNTDGNGEGEVFFTIALKQAINDATTFGNKANIVFDTEAAIETPVWTNTTDFVRPSSHISTIEMLDSTYHFIFDATDSGSGIWKYDLYGKRAESSEWELLFRDIKDSEFTQVIPEGASYNYCVVATDMAGNRELKELHAEGLELLTGDADGNGMVDVADVMVITNHFLGNNVDINLPNADVNSDNAIDSQDCMGVNAIYLNASDKARIKNLPTRYKPTQK